MTAKDSLVAYFPEFKDETEQRVALFNAVALSCISASTYKGKVAFAQVLMTAHLIEMANRRGVSGVVAQERMGPQATVYASPPSTQDSTALDETSYGKMLKDIGRRVFRGGLAI